MIEDEQDADGGWVDTHHYDNTGAVALEEKVRYSYLQYVCDKINIFLISVSLV